MVRGVSGKPLITITDKGLSSMKTAVESLFHEKHHIDKLLKSGFTSAEAHAKKMYKAFWAAYKNL